MRLCSRSKLLMWWNTLYGFCLNTRTCSCSTSHCTPWLKYWLITTIAVFTMLALAKSAFTRRDSS